MAERALQLADNVMLFAGPANLVQTFQAMGDEQAKTYIAQFQLVWTRAAHSTTQPLAEDVWDAVAEAFSLQPR